MGVGSGVGVFSGVVAGVATGSCAVPLTGVGVGVGFAVAVGSGIDVAVEVTVGSGVGAGLSVQAIRTTAMDRAVSIASQRIRKEGTAISVVSPCVVLELPGARPAAACPSLSDLAACPSVSTMPRVHVVVYRKHIDTSLKMGRSGILRYHIGAAHDEPSPGELGSGLAHRSRRTPSTKVLDFIQFGGPERTELRTLRWEVSI